MARDSSAVVTFEPFPEKLPETKQRKIRSLVGESPKQEESADEERAYAEWVALAPPGVEVPPRNVKKKRSRPGFWHQGRKVLKGEVIECDHDIAQMLVSISKKAEYVE